MGINAPTESKNTYHKNWMQLTGSIPILRGQDIQNATSSFYRAQAQIATPALAYRTTGPISSAKKGFGGYN